MNKRMLNVFPSGIKSLGFLGGEDPDSNYFADALSSVAGGAKQMPLLKSSLNIHISHIRGCAGKVCFVFNSLCF